MDFVSTEADETFDGSSDADSYQFDVGFGADVIVDPSANNVIRFGAGIERDDLRFVRPAGSDDLLIEVGLEDSLRLQDFFNASSTNASRSRPVGVIEFVDGATFDLTSDVLTFEGTNGPDDLRGTSGADILIGGAGDDTLNGGSGADVYAFESGFGSDTIVDGDQANIIRFGAGIALADLRFERPAGSDDLLIHVGATDSLQLQDFFNTSSTNASRSRPVGVIEFADGETFDLTTDVLTFEGTNGPDDLRGTSGADILIGGAGDDTLNGGSGADVYAFEQGFGADTIVDGDQNNIISLGAAIALSDLRFERPVGSDDLLIHIGATDSLQLQDFFNTSSTNASRLLPVGVIQFADGATFDLTSDVLTFEGANGPDDIRGTSGADILIGGAGDDTLNGGSGADVYAFEKGFGSDTIADDDQSNIISFGAGIALADLRFERPVGSVDLLLHVGATDSLRLQDFFNTSSTNASRLLPVGVIEFANGEMFDLTTAVLTFEGTAGADDIRGTNADDVIVGSSGDDTLSGGRGSDTHVFAPGFGMDTIAESEGDDGGVIRFEGGIGPEDVRLFRDPADARHLVVQVGDDAITILNQYNTTSPTAFLTHRINRIEFTDGGDPIDLTGDGLVFSGTDEADVIIGSDQSHTLDGGAGGDTINDGDGSSTIIGGTGDDTLSGGDGFDTYVFTPGFGMDTIADSEVDSGDAIRFEGGIGPEDVRLFRDPANARHLVVQVGDDAITILNQYNTTSPFAFLTHRISRIEFADGGDPIDLTGDGLLFSGTDEADVIIGSDQSHTLDGGAGDDTINDGDGASTIVGGTGDDTLSGGQGFDTYVFAPGFGMDTISDGGGDDGGAIRFEGGIGPDDLRIFRDPANARHLVVQVGDDAIRILNQYNTTSPTAFLTSLISRIEFADGGDPIDLTGDGLVFSGTEDADVIIGSDQSHTLEGGGGDDTINDGDGSSTIVGGTGDDTLSGGQGFDTYVFAPGFGEDTISDGGGNDGGAIRFEGDIGPDDLRIFRDPANARHLVVQVGDDAIRILNQYNTTSPTAFLTSLISRIEFADGGDPIDLTGDGLVFSGTDDADVIIGSDQSHTLEGGGGDDTINDGDGSSTIVGGTGDDTLSGGNGFDTYVFAPGFGTDTISESSGDNGGAVRFEGGIGPEDVRFVRPAGSRDLLLEVGADDSIRVSSQFSSTPPNGTGNQRISRFEFENGQFFDNPDLDLLGAPATALPTALDDVASTVAGETVEIDLLDNDSDPDGDPLAIGFIENQADDFVVLVSGSTVMRNGDGTVAFAPSVAYGDLPVGTTFVESFDYAVSDGRGGFATANVDVMISIEAAMNTPPVVADVATLTDEDIGIFLDLAFFAGGFSDADGDALQAVRIATLPTIGALTLDGEAVEANDEIARDDLAAGLLRYAPAPNAFGVDMFEFSASDGAIFAQPNATATIEVASVNDAPGLAPIADATIGEGDTLSIRLDLSDPDSQFRSFVIDYGDGSAPDMFNRSGATVFQNHFYETQGIFTVSVTVDDNAGAANSVETQTFMVTAENRAPFGIQVFGLANEDGPAIVVDPTTPDNDPGGDPLALTMLADEPVVVGEEIALPSGAIIRAEADGSVIYDPNGAFEFLSQAFTAFDDFVQYAVEDDEGLSASGNLRFRVIGDNDAPVARDDGFEASELSVFLGDLFADNGAGEDIDPDRFDTFQIIAVNGEAAALGTPVNLPSGGVLTVGQDGQFSYDPTLVPRDVLDETFEYTIADQHGATSTAVASIAIDRTNQPPTAVDDMFTSGEDAGVSGNVLTDSGVDFDADGDPVTVIALNGDIASLDTNILLASGARVILREDGSFDYDPNGAFESLGAGATGADSFEYTIADGLGGTAVGTVSIEIEGANDRPSSPNVTLQFDGDGGAGDALASATDIDIGDVLSVSAVNFLPENVGAEIALGDLAAITIEADGAYVIDPGVGFDRLREGDVGLETVRIEASDIAGATRNFFAFVRGVGVNDAPMASDDMFEVGRDAAIAGDLFGDNGTGLDFDVDDGDAFQVSAVDGDPTAIGDDRTLASGAILTVNDDGTFAYDPNGAFATLNAGETATETFVYEIRDALGATDEATATITIVGAAEPPVAADDEFATTADDAFSGDLLDDNGNGADADPNNDPLTVISINGAAGDVGREISLPSGATLRANADGSFDYDPNGAFMALPAGAAATDSFFYRISDGLGGEDEATVTIAIQGVNDAPSAADDAFTARSVESQIAGDVFANNGEGLDADPDLGDMFAVASVNGAAASVGAEVALPSGALLTLNADGTFVYELNGAFAGLGVGENAIDSFEYTIEDDGGLSDSATATIFIEGAPSAADLTARSVVLPSGAEGARVFATYEVTNLGDVAAEGGYLERLYFSTDATLDDGDVLARTIVFDDDLAAGGSYGRTVRVDLPDMSGAYRLLVEIDGDNAIDDFNRANNVGVSPAANVSSAFTAAITSAPALAANVAPIQVAGLAVNTVGGGRAAFEFVEVEIESGVFTRTIDVLTDIDGRFAFDFSPLPGEAGAFRFTARNPSTPNEDASFEAETFIFGMAFDQQAVSGRVIEGESVDFELTLENLADFDLTGLTARVEGLAEGFDVVAEVQDTLAGDASATVMFTATAPDGASTPQEDFKLVLESAEGASASADVSLTVIDPVPALQINLDELKSGMVLGEQTLVSFRVTNVGGDDTGPIAVGLPNAPFLGLVTPATIGSLGPQESANVTLALSPAPDLALALYEGSVRLSSAEADASIPFSFNAVSDQTGDLEVTVVDELFFLTTEQPKVDDAQVVVRDALTGEIVAESDDVDGVIVFEDLPAGFYEVSAMADGHDVRTQTVELRAGQVNEFEAFLSQQSVSYEFSVREIEVEDRYVVSVESTFTTSVPQPVVIMEPPVIDLFEADQIGDVLEVEITLRNEGLIQAEDIIVDLGSHPYFTIEPLIDRVATLDAQSSITIPVTITRVADQFSLPGEFATQSLAGEGPEDEATSPSTAPLSLEAFDAAPGATDAFALPSDAGLAPLSPAAATSPSVPCFASGVIYYSYLCGPYDVVKSIPIGYVNLGADCYQPGGLLGLFGGGGGGAGGGGVGGGGGGGGGGGTRGVGGDGEPGIPYFSYTPFAPITEICDFLLPLFDPEDIPPQDPMLEPLRDIEDFLSPSTPGELIAPGNPEEFLVPRNLEEATPASNIQGVIDTVVGVLEALDDPVSAHPDLFGDSVPNPSDKPREILQRAKEVTEATKAVSAAFDAPLVSDAGKSIDEEIVQPLSEALDDLEGAITPGPQESLSPAQIDAARAALAAYNAAAEQADGTGDVIALRPLVRDLQNALDALEAAIEADPNVSPPAGFEDAVDRANSAYADVRQSIEQVEGTYLDALRARDDAQGFVDAYANIFGDEVWLGELNEPTVLAFLQDFAGRIRANDAIGSRLSEADIAALLELPLPPEVRGAPVLAFLERWNASMDAYDAGAFNTSDPGAGMAPFLAGDFLSSDLDKVEQDRLDALADGFASTEDAINDRLDAGADYHNALDPGVCATVRIRIDQEAVLTRQGFEAALEIENIDDEDLTNIEITIDVRTAEGDFVGSETFNISQAELEGISAVDGSGVLAAGAAGRAAFNLIPSRLAAPDGPTTFYVGGRFSYENDGNMVSVPLALAPINVVPQAALVFDYFQQRDVFADDPFTDDIVEASVPFALGLLVRNEGGGVARDFSITSGQPEIIDNESGLLIDFEIIGSELNGAPAQPTLEVDFGDLAAGESAVATFLLQSSLQGTFSDYEASFRQVNPLGNEEFSLITDVNVHELIQIVSDERPGADALPDFLANEEPDAASTPDTVFFSEGGSAPVSVGIVGAIDDDATDREIEVEVAFIDGFGYASFADPAGDRILEVRRSDGSLLSEDNFWQTDRTFPESGARPIFEDRIHIFDHFAGARTESYTILFDEPLPNLAPDAQDDGGDEFRTDAGTPFSTPNVLANDSDPDAGDAFSLSEVEGEPVIFGETLTLASGALLTPRGNGVFDYDPNGAFPGLTGDETAEDSFTYTITDGELSDTATVTIGIDAPPPLSLDLQLEQGLAAGEVGEAIVSYTNNGFGETGGLASGSFAAATSSVSGLKATLLAVSADRGLVADQFTGGFSSTAYALGRGVDGGALGRGETSSISVPVKGVAGPRSRLEVSAQAADPLAETDIAARLEALQPSFLAPSAALLAINAERLLGPSVLTLTDRLADFDDKFASFGLASGSASAALGYALETAGDFGSIAERANVGGLGKGWSSLADISLAIDGDAVQLNGLSDLNALRALNIDSAALYTVSASVGRSVSLGGDVLAFTAPLRTTFEKGADGAFRTSGDFDGRLVETADGYMALLDDGDRLEFDQAGAFLRMAMPDGLEIAAGRDAEGRVTALDGPNGARLAFARDGEGRVMSIEDADGNAAAFAYDGDGMLTDVTRPEGASAFAYDGDGNLLTAIAPGGIGAAFAYDGDGRLEGVSYGGGLQSESFAYDDAGGLTVTDGAGRATAIDLLPGGVAGRIVDGLGSESTLEFDENGDLLGVRAPDGTFTRFAFDDQDRLTTIEDANGAILTFGYEGDSEEPSSFTDAGGGTRSFEYDAGGRITQATWPDGTELSFEYDDEGNLAGYSNRRGDAVTYTYDARGRLLTESDSSAGPVAYVYDDEGRLVSATNDQGETRLAYDDADRVTEIHYPTGKSLFYTYNEAGLRASMSDGEDYNLFYDYDALGRLSRLRDETSQIVEYVYDAAGNLIREENGNGTVSTFEYDMAGRLTVIENLAPDGSLNSRQAYAYDVAGQRIGVDTLDGDWTYGYDAIGQLTFAEFISERDDVDDKTIVYEYDPAGNRTRVIEDGIETLYEANELNQYTQVGDATFAYDADGNMISRTDGEGVTTYAYDLDNRLVSVVESDGSELAFEYDVFGSRIETTTRVSNEKYFIDPFGFGNIIQTSSDGMSMKSHIHGLGLTATISESGKTYYSDDAIGNIISTTNDTGNKDSETIFSPFGKPLTLSENFKFGFNGVIGAVHDETDLIYMRSRYYTPELGRFIEQDPRWRSGDIENQYRFALNDPIQFVDPSGEAPIIQIAAIAVALVVGAGVYIASSDPSDSESAEAAGPSAADVAVDIGQRAVTPGSPTGATSAVGAGIEVMSKGGIPAHKIVETFNDGAGPGNHRMQEEAADILQDAFEKTTRPNDDDEGRPFNEIIPEAGDEVPIEDAPPAGSDGDPHIITFDNIGYSFQAVGEFVLFRTTDGASEFQVRQAPVPGSDSVSVNTAVATEMDGVRVGIYADRATPLSIDGRAVEMEAGQTIAIGGGSVYFEGRFYVVTDAEGSGVWVRVASDGPDAFLNIRAFVDAANAGATQGLVGDGDGNSLNDIALPDGTVLEQPFPDAALYLIFGEAWRVDDATSLFEYGDGETTETFTDRGFPANIVTLDDLDPEARAEAEAIAEAAGLTPGTFRFETTVLDIALTGNPEFAAAVAEAPTFEPEDEVEEADPVETVAEPLAMDDAGPGFETTEDDAFTTADVRANDSAGVIGEAISVASVDLAGVVGDVVDNGDGTFAYDPTGRFEALGAGETATDRFGYTIEDENGLTASAEVVVTINGVNDAPVAGLDAGVGFGTDEDTAFTTANVLLNDQDVEEDALSVVGLDLSDTIGRVTDNGDGTFDYDPDGRFEDLDDGEAATDRFRYEVSDGNGGTAVGEVIVTIAGVDDGPDMVEGSDGSDSLNGTDADEVFEPGPGPIDVSNGGGGADVFVFGPETTNGAFERDYVYGFGPDDKLDLGAASIIREINTPFATVLVLDGDGDIIFLPGLADFDETTQLVGAANGAASFAAFTAGPILGTSGQDILTGTNADDVFRPLGGDGDRSTSGGGADVFEFGAEVSNGVFERDYIHGFDADDRLDLGGAGILREINGADRTALILEGDGDIIILTGVADFDEATQLV